MEGYILEKDIKVLKSLINDNLELITADDWKEFGRSYGNILIKTSNKIIEIVDDYCVLPYFGEEEDLAIFQVKNLKSIDEYTPSVMNKNLCTTLINEKINSIKIIRDTVTLILDDNKKEVHKIDQYIIFELEKTKWLIGRQFIFTPMADMIFGDDIYSKVKTTEEVEKEWIDYDEDGVAQNEVIVEREVLEL